MLRFLFPNIISNFSGKVATSHVPMTYSEIEDQSSQDTKPRDNQTNRLEDFCPPASSKDNEYHIMKFYSFNSSLVNGILSESNVKVDFPFCETELEHAIINLQPDPPSSLLLMGRSGTGKLLLWFFSCFLFLFLHT